MEQNIRIKFPNPLSDWVFPRRCFICNQDVSTGNVCASCESMFNKCPNYFSIEKKTSALFYFELSMKTLIKDIKYRRKIPHVQILQGLIKDALHTSPLGEDLMTFSPSVITHVPTHWINLIVRRSDVPQLFAYSLSRELRVPYRSLLIRKKFNSRQVLRTTKNERLFGINGSFDLRHKKHQYERILLVDDIVTTGATMAESRKMLNKIAREVRCLALAKTP